MSKNSRRAWSIAGLIALLVFAGTVWPTYYRYWKLDTDGLECLLRQHRITGQVERLCPVSMDRGWVEMEPEKDE